jgi:tRNA-dihydrouridine synthase
MIGRGLLARPSLASEYVCGTELSWEKRRIQLHDMHDHLKAHYETTVNSEAQLHARLRLFWEYMEEELGRKVYKKIMKAGNLKNYLAAVKEV